MGTSDIWTIKAALDWTVGYFKRKGDVNPRLSAQWLLSAATGLSRIELYTNFDRPLSLVERDVLHGYVERRGQGEPLQYITGEVYFRYLPVKVRPGVLIPRPETEVLVSEALALLPAAPRPRAKEEDPFVQNGEDIVQNGEDQKHNPSQKPGLPSKPEVGPPAPKRLLVADIGTGSGCIACSLGYEHPLVHVVATDISPVAVALARENAKALGLSERVEVLGCDLGAGIGAALMGCFDLVVSNPPYIPTAILSDMSREVIDYEPALALDGGADGLAVVRRLLPWCARALKPGGSFAFELHETCLDAAAALARASGFSDVRIVRDLADRPRVLTGCYL